MEIKSRFDHFNINVTDLDRSIAFYDKALGLRETGRKEASDGGFTLVYLGDGQSPFRLELTWLRDHAAAPYELGENESHLHARGGRLRRRARAPPRHGLRLLRKPRHGALLHQRPRRLLDRNITPEITAMQTQTEMQREVDEAVRTMRAGGIILYPTDTVWGLGCDATSSAAVERIYRLKRSGNKKSMLVLCASADMIVRYVNKAPGIAFEVMELATSPLTAILPGAAGLAENLIPDEGTLGVRIPDHEFCRRMLRALGRPIVSTSANISGEATPVGLQDVAREIIDGVDFVVNPRFEGKPTRKASSIIAFGEGGEVKIIRE